MTLPTNEELLSELRECHRIGTMTNNFGNMMAKIIDSLYVKNKTCVYREEASQLACDYIMTHWMRFNEQKSENPFAYFYNLCRSAYAKAGHTYRKEQNESI